MSTTVDFRTLPFSANKVVESGKYVGKAAYWRLHAIENLFRIIIHSVLSAQLSPNWWGLVIDHTTNGNVQRFKQRYLNLPGSTLPGSHDIYYLFLSDLNKIIASQRNLFIQPIPDIDQWIIKLEQIHLPRNIVGHMNWPSTADINRIDKTYKEARILVRKFHNSDISIIIP